jgi:3-oxoacyl-[acyl-carrier protein] reductase
VSPPPAPAGGRFAGKRVLVTGAGAGIGRALSEAFAAEGAAILAVDIDEERAADTARRIMAAGGRAEAHRLDVGDAAQVEAVLSRALGTGGLDVLVNNAGIAYGDIYQVLELPAARLEELLRTNVLGMIYCARSCRAALAKTGGSIVNLSSMASYMANGAYSLTKAAVNNLTLVLAEELSGENIRVNAIAPGLIDSPAAMTLVNERFRRRIHEAQLVRRQGTMQDVAQLALFLASSAAAFITGQVMLIDGGYLRHSAKAMPVPIAALPDE